MSDVVTSTGRDSLQGRMDAAGGPVSLLRSSQLGPYIFPTIPSEFTNWRDEQRAWHDDCALLELSYHMTELHLKGPGALALLSTIAVNKFGTFPVLRAKQLVLADHDGYLIGDAILFREEEEFFRIVGAPFAADWVQYNAERGGYDVEVTRDENFSVRSGTRDVFRVQIQGPKALPFMQEVTDGTLPEIGFFNIGEFSIASRPVRALRHGMAGEPGFEIYGAWNDQQAVRDALERVGAIHGLRKVGALAYSTTGTQSGWMPMPLPAIYHGEAMRPYREWLSPSHLETLGSLGGSLRSERIEDYYVDPIEVGYRSLIDFGREFIGRDALRRRADDQRRRKVTFVWNADDVMDALRSSLFDASEPGKHLGVPNSMYATFECDAVMKGGRIVGNSQWSCFTANANAQISLGVVDVELSAPGTEVTLLWGEPDSRRHTVERNTLREIRAHVAPAPFFEKVIKTRQQ